MKLGTVHNHGFDQTGHERREMLTGIAECPDCGEQVELWSETEAWVEAAPESGHPCDRAPAENRWRHSEYGPGTGECKCGAVIVNTFDGCFVIRPEKSSA